jgi:hypothetical protein
MCAISWGKYIQVAIWLKSYLFCSSHSGGISSWFFFEKSLLDREDYILHNCILLYVIWGNLCRDIMDKYFISTLILFALHCRCCKGNPCSPDPNPSKPLVGPDQTYPLVFPATCSTHDRSAPGRPTHDCSTPGCSAHICPAHTITISPPPAGLYIPPHRWTQRPTRWTVGLMIIDTYYLDYLMPYLLPPLCSLASSIRFH